MHPLSLRRDPLVVEPGMWVTADGRFCIHRTFGGAGKKRGAQWHINPTEEYDYPYVINFLDRHMLAPRMFVRRKDALAALHAAVSVEDQGRANNDSTLVTYQTNEGWRLGSWDRIEDRLLNQMCVSKLRFSTREKAFQFMEHGMPMILDAAWV